MSAAPAAPAEKIEKKIPPPQPDMLKSWHFHHSVECYRSDITTKFSGISGNLHRHQPGSNVRPGKKIAPHQCRPTVAPKHNLDSSHGALHRTPSKNADKKA